MVQTGTLKLKSAKSIVEILIFEVSDIENSFVHVKIENIQEQLILYILQRTSFHEFKSTHQVALTQLQPPYSSSLLPRIALYSDTFSTARV